MSIDTESKPAPKARRRAVMTKGDWERVERNAQRGEHEPDPAQITLLPDERRVISRIRFLTLFLRSAVKVDEVTGRKSLHTRDETRTRKAIGRGILRAPAIDGTHRQSPTARGEFCSTGHAATAVDYSRLPLIPAVIPESLRVPRAAA